MIKRILCATFCLFALAAQAQEFPALFDVTGVAANDVLNLRAEPNADAAIVGTLAPDTKAVEGVDTSADGKWIMVGLGETTGWAARRFLAEQPGQSGPLLSRPLVCFGTEPFWSVDLSGNGALSFEAMGAQPAEGSIAIARSANRTDKEGFLSRTTGDLLIAGTLTRTQCGDGMSDRLYGISLDLIVNAAGGDALYSGCCSLR